MQLSLAKLTSLKFNPSTLSPPPTPHPTSTAVVCFGINMCHVQILCASRHTGKDITWSNPLSEHELCFLHI